MNICNEIQQKIAELGLNEIIENQDELKHIESCQACQEYQQACEEMSLAMSEIENNDADDTLVESTLNSILSLQVETKKPKSLLNTQWASALAASFMLVSLIALFPYNSVSNFGIFSDAPTNVKSSVTDEEKQKIKNRKEALSKEKQDDSGFEFVEVEVANEVYDKQRIMPKKAPPPSSKRTFNEMKNNQVNLSTANVASHQELNSHISKDSLQKNMQDNYKQDAKKELANLTPADLSNSPQEQNELLYDAPLEETVGVNLNSDGVGQALVYPDYTKDQYNYQRQDGRDEDDSVELLENVIPTGSRISSNDLEEPAPVSSISREQRQDKSVSIGENINTVQVENDNEMIEAEEMVADGLLEDSIDKDQIGAQKRAEDIRIAIEQRRNQMRDNAKGKKQTGELDKIVATGSRIKRDDNNNIPSSIDKHKYAGLFKQRYAKGIMSDDTPKKLTPAQEFLAELNSMEDVKYQNATGYWANNYLPGDASMRLLGAELLKNDVDIESIVEQNRQPFDYPDNSALEVYLSSDQSYVNSQEPTRMKLQVGIQASNRKGGHRSAMNIGVIFDVSNNNLDSNKKMKALLLALLKAKQASDNISVTLTGANGGLVIKASEFRYGTIQALMNDLKSVDDKQQSVAISLHQAIKLASVNLQNDDDPTASLGSSVVMLVTDKNIDDLTQIQTTVHSNAVNGITLSTVSLATDNQQLNQLALAGQGHSRILQNENDAKRVIDAEIFASSRAVARALRLRIRLAKGVKLIKVLDSYNLNEKQAQRVRDAENSLDQRLSKNLGIQADRGEDEEGIQIVIPSFFAGDTHVVILDVVVNNPGAIADVSMRYKDLLYLRNAISRKQLNLSNDEKPMGPLQMNVLKNVLASRFISDIKQASIFIKNGKNDTALFYLLNLQKLYQSLRQEFPVWNNDAEILKDEKLIQQYIDLIIEASKSDAPQVNYIINSLQYISWRKNITQSK